jgi:hypothetical protein
VQDAPATLGDFFIRGTGVAQLKLLHAVTGENEVGV